MGEDAGATPDAIAREHLIAPGRRDECLRELRARGYIAERPGGESPIPLTTEGCAAYDRLADARRQRLQELSAEWPEPQRKHIALILQRLARDLVPERGA
jgi:hypothetical protein